MKQNDFFTRGLPKWPCLLVTGKPVTIEQAQEILIRTDNLFFCSNDKSFESAANKLVYGVSAPSYNLSEELQKHLNTDNWGKIYSHQEKCRNRYGVLELAYLQNKQIISTYIGGPHGWCDWNGNIGCNSYNIGKWPSVKEVYEDWVKIAKEFPYLDLASQLLSGEQCEDGIKPVVEFVVKNGKVKMVEPKTILTNVEQNDDEKILAGLFSPGRERGCTITILSKALDYVEEKMITLKKSKKKKKTT